MNKWMEPSEGLVKEFRQSLAIERQMSSPPPGIYHVSLQVLFPANISAGSIISEAKSMQGFLRTAELPEVPGDFRWVKNVSAGTFERTFIPLPSSLTDFGGSLPYAVPTVSFAIPAYQSQPTLSFYGGQSVFIYGTGRDSRTGMMFGTRAKTRWGASLPYYPLVNSARRICVWTTGHTTGTECYDPISEEVLNVPKDYPVPMMLWDTVDILPPVPRIANANGHSMGRNWAGEEMSGDSSADSMATVFRNMRAGCCGW